MASHQVYPVEMGPMPGSPGMEGTSQRTHTSLLDPFTGKNYPRDSHTLTLWLIIIAIVTFFITLIVNIFFVYVPIARMEEKFDTTVQKLDDVAGVVKVSADGVDKIVEDVESLGKIVVADFDKVKGGICAWLRAEGIDFPFCSEGGVEEVSVTGIGNRVGTNTNINTRRNLRRSNCKTCR